MKIKKKLTIKYFSYNSATYQIRVGATYSHNDGIIYHIERVHAHEQYDPHSYNNNIAVLKISGTLSFSKNVRPIYMAARYYRPGTRASVTGWGYLRQNGPYSNVLMEAIIPIIDHDTCRGNYRRINMIVSESELCAGDHKGGKLFQIISY